ncbi:hypothetical protein TSOC_012650 [Tetrabaena socialis]|uniref:Uncharacterized protein n=1 Tax=Tetrabaena socialis TaxID=47790 RepID=A0A2J7ZMI4_9CHLO|nr:hypothetical protein TSOC_012650 [Tetrabaena socialis]|eukprot:PNH01460.1 hypothetical protein TSOC_012650 [Tetrabaena socialis]
MHALRRAAAGRPALARRSGRTTTCKATPPAVSAVAVNGSTQAYDRMRGIKVARSSDGALIDITSLWGADERAVVAELAIQLRRDVKPKLDEMGIKLFLVRREGDLSRRGVTGFPADLLFADPGNALYDALGLVRGVGATFFSADTPLAIKRRMDEGRTGDLGDVLSRWQPWLPPKSEQAYQQGGLFLFEGERTLLSHYDKATGAHADFAQLLGLAEQLAAAPDCGEAACELPPAGQR